MWTCAGGHVPCTDTVSSRIGIMGSNAGSVAHPGDQTTVLRRCLARRVVAGDANFDVQSSANDSMENLVCS